MILKLLPFTSIYDTALSHKTSLSHILGILKKYIFLKTVVLAEYSGV